MQEIKAHNTKMTRDDVEIIKIDRENQLPGWLPLETLSQFLYDHLDRFRDPLEVTFNGVKRALNGGGFVLIALHEETLLGALVMLKTGMDGYIPENLLLFVGVSSDARGRGIGGKLVQASCKHADGDIKLHVEHDNPAARLYERCGFTSKYKEMRFHKK